MPTYRSVIRRAEYWEDDHTAACQPTSITIHEDKDPVYTGVLDAKGNPIYRYPDTVTMGYCGKSIG